MTTVLNVELKLTKEEKEKIVNECLDILNERLIEELEKIKGEIENIPNDETTKPIGTYDYCLGANNERRIVLEILDKHINKADCDNDCEHCEWVECPKE